MFAPLLSKLRFQAGSCQTGHWKRKKKKKKRKNNVALFKDIRQMPRT